MGQQRTDRQVAADAARFNETTRALRRILRKQGIRNVHTSLKAKAAIERAKQSNHTLSEAIEAIRERVG